MAPSLRHNIFLVKLAWFRKKIKHRSLHTEEKNKRTDKVALQVLKELHMLLDFNQNDRLDSAVLAEYI